MANGIYKKADAICAVSETYARRAMAVNSKCDSYTVAYLGTKLSVFDQYREHKPILKKPEGEVWMAYIGTLGYSYDLTCVMDAMSLLGNKGKAYCLRFIVIGDGPLREKLESYASKLSLPVTFTGMLPYYEMVPLLCSCDFAVNPIKRGAASIINKVGDYAAAGLAVVNTQECPEYRALVDSYSIGVNCENGDVSQLADAIDSLATNKKLRLAFGANNRRLAEERFDRAKSYMKIKDLILHFSR
jgi:glycosyltransferase involved in cell wall biosynthesis